MRIRGWPTLYFPYSCRRSLKKKARETFCVLISSHLGTCKMRRSLPAPHKNDASYIQSSNLRLAPCDRPGFMVFICRSAQ